MSLNLEQLRMPDVDTTEFNEENAKILGEAQKILKEDSVLIEEANTKYIEYLRSFNESDLELLIDQIQNGHKDNSQLLLSLIHFLVDKIKEKNQKIKQLQRRVTTKDKEITKLQKSQTGLRTKYDQVNKSYKELKDIKSTNDQVFPNDKITISSVDDFYAAHIKVFAKNNCFCS